MTSVRRHEQHEREDAQRAHLAPPQQRREKPDREQRLVLDALLEELRSDRSDHRRPRRAAPARLRINLFQASLPESMDPVFSREGSRQEARAFRERFLGVRFYWHGGTVYAYGQPLLVGRELSEVGFSRTSIACTQEPRLATALMRDGLLDWCDSDPGLWVQPRGVVARIVRTDAPFYEHPAELLVYEGLAVQTLFWRAPEGPLAFALLVDWETQQEFAFTLATCDDPRRFIGGYAIGWAPDGEPPLAAHHRRLVGKIEEVTRRDGELLVRLSDHRLADEWVPAAALKPEASPAAVARADLGQGGAIAREVRSRAGELANGRVRSDALCQRDQRLLSLLRRVARGDRLDFPLPTGQPCHVPLEATRVVLLGEEVSGGP